MTDRRYRTTIHDIKSTQNTGIENTNRRHMTAVLDSSFYSLPESSRCVFHYPPKRKHESSVGFLTWGLDQLMKADKRERSRGSGHSGSKLESLPIRPYLFEVTKQGGAWSLTLVWFDLDFY